MTMTTVIGVFFVAFGAFCILGEKYHDNPEFAELGEYFIVAGLVVLTARLVVGHFA